MLQPLDLRERDQPVQHRILPAVAAFDERHRDGRVGQGRPERLFSAGRDDDDRVGAAAGGQLTDRAGDQRDARDGAERFRRLAAEANAGTGRHHHGDDRFG